MPKGRFWCFTSYDTDGHPPFDNQLTVYITYQKERCPTTQRLHWQGYIELRTAATRATVKSILGSDGAHCELARGGDAAIDYCHKEETRVEGPFEFGERGGPIGGRRTDLDAVAERVRRPGGLDWVVNNVPAMYIKYHRGIHALRNHFIGVRDPATPPDVRVYHGPSGAGKTRAVYDEQKHLGIYQKDGSKWWDGYDGQGCILMDDWAGSDAVPPTELLKILDRYPHRVETKGGYVVLGPAIIILTSMISHEEWYRSSEKWRKQLIPFNRRVTQWRQFGGGTEQPAQTVEDITGERWLTLSPIEEI